MSMCQFDLHNFLYIERPLVIFSVTKSIHHFATVLLPTLLGLRCHWISNCRQFWNSLCDVTVWIEFFGMKTCRFNNFMGKFSIASPFVNTLCIWLCSWVFFSSLLLSGFLSSDLSRNTWQCFQCFFHSTFIWHQSVWFEFIHRIFFIFHFHYREGGHGSFVLQKATIFHPKMKTNKWKSREKMISRAHTHCSIVHSIVHACNLLTQLSLALTTRCDPSRVFSKKQKNK